MNKFLDYIEKSLKIIVSFLIFMMTIIIFLQVISRYVFNRSLTWSEEAGRYLFIWISFLASALAVRSNKHISLDLLVNKISEDKKNGLDVLKDITISIIGAIICYGGIQLMSIGAHQKSSSLGIPMSIVYLVIPISGILMILFSINKITKKREDKK